MKDDGELGTGLRDRVLARFGFTTPPPATVDGLNTLYSAWNRWVPFDNLQKRLALATGPAAALPCATPEEFFARYLAHGTGATCWPSSTALHALLCSCGFEAIRLAGTMMPTGVDHGSVLVRMAGHELLVDAWMDERPLLLPPGGPAPVGPADGRIEPYGSLWRVRYLHPTREEHCFFDVKERDVSFARMLAGYEGSRTNSRFNTHLFARKNVAGGVLCLTRGGRHFRDAGGLTRRELAPDEVARLLIEEFGYSEEIVARLPPDEPEP
jgi:N-hydroxyarylamine O-acetyltransferase